MGTRLRSRGKAIRDEVAKGVKNRGKVEHYRMKPPYTVEIEFLRPPDALQIGGYPGAKQVSARTVQFTHAEILEASRFIESVYYALAGVAN